MKNARTAILPLSVCGALLLATAQARAQDLRWIQQLGTTAMDASGDIAPDGVGGSYVCGTTWGSLAGQSAGQEDPWLARVNTQGRRLWVKQFGSPGSDFAYGAAADGAGGVYVAGTTSGSLGGASAGGMDAWLARYDGTGAQTWIRQFGTNLYDAILASAPDGTGGVYVCGSTAASLGGLAMGFWDAWVARYDSAGNRVWIRQLGSTLYDAALAAAPDGAGGVYLCGNTTGSLGGTNLGSDDAWIAHYDGAGNQVWIQQLGTSASDIAYAAAADGAGGVFVAGSTGGSLGGTGAGILDAWVARYDSAGNQVWLRQLGTGAQDEGYAVTSDGRGGAIVAGATTGSLGGSNKGVFDAWLAQLDSAGSTQWILQLGSTENDSVTRAAADGSGGFYLCGSTAGGLGGTNRGSNDAWLARFRPPATLLCEPGLGGVAACPCSNPAQGPARGCDNSSATGGALLIAAGDAVVSVDTLVFTARREGPSALSMLLQGTSVISLGANFGQGVRCVGGTLRRLYTRTASAGTVILPDILGGDPTISARSAALGDPILGGQSRWYMVYYRDPIVLGGCPATSTFNSGPTMRADWLP